MIQSTQLLQLQHVVASHQGPARGSSLFSCSSFSTCWCLTGASASGPFYTAAAVSAHAGILMGPPQRGPVYTAAPASAHSAVLPGPHHGGPAYTAPAVTATVEPDSCQPATAKGSNSYAEHMLHIYVEVTATGLPNYITAHHQLPSNRQFKE